MNARRKNKRRQRPKPSAPPAPWWKRTATKVVAGVGSLVLAAVTGVVTAVVTKAGDEVSQPLLRDALGDPVHVTAGPLPRGEETVLARSLPDGITPQVHEMLSGPTGYLDHEDDLGVPLGQARLRVIVQAKNSKVFLTGLWLVVDERDPPIDRTVLFVNTQGGGKPIQVRFDADARDSGTTRGTAARNVTGQSYFAGENYELDVGGAVEFHVAVGTRSCYCRFHLELETTAAGQTKRVRIEHGSFAVSAAVPEPKEALTIPVPGTSTRTNLGTVGPWVRIAPEELCAESPMCQAETMATR